MAQRVVSVVWRALVVAVVYALVYQPFRLLAGPRPPSGAYFGGIATDLVTGAAFALVLLPLARRLPYRAWTRTLALFVPLYWIYSLSNLVEAGFYTTASKGGLVFVAVYLLVATLVASWLIARLLPATEPQGSGPRLGELLGQRPLLSWAWRVLLAGVLFAVFINVFGTLWGPLISKYYHDPAFIALAHTASQPDAVAWPEEIARGVVFVLVLLPVLAVVRGRDWPAILLVGAYVALIDAAFEGWLAMLADTSFPLGFRIGEGLDLTTDALARGIFVAALLALPTVWTRRVEAAPAQAAS